MTPKIDKYAYQRIKSEIPFPAQVAIALLMVFTPFFIAMTSANFRQPKQADTVIGLGVLLLAGGAGIKAAKTIINRYE